MGPVVSVVILLLKMDSKYYRKRWSINLSIFSNYSIFNYKASRKKKTLLLIYRLAEIIGGILASFFIYFIIGNEVNLGANAKNYSNYTTYVIIGIEIAESEILMLIIMMVVYTKGLKKFGGLAIGATVGLDIFLFGLISGASMNPARSLSPAILSGYYTDLCLYLTAPFILTSIVAFFLSKKF